MVRLKAGRHPSPSAAILNSQTRRLSTMLAKAIGYDAAKHIKGRKLHLLVDTLGLVLVAVVSAANVSERDGTRLVFVGIRGAPPQQTKGFIKRPVRWRVERTFGWLNWCRRFSKDYGGLAETHEAMVYATIVRLMVRRLI